MHFIRLADSLDVNRYRLPSHEVTVDLSHGR